jgi:transposase
MSKKERQRLLVLSRVRDQGMTLRQASQVLDISYRQIKRTYKRFVEEGEAGLIHKNRGKISGRGFDPIFKQAVLDLCKGKYAGFGPTLAAEKLIEYDDLVLDHETLRRWLIADGVWQRRRRRSTYRARRTPRSHFGELVQMDGSHHQWFEDRGAKTCLMNMVDDATKTTLSLMDKEETTDLAMRLLMSWIEHYGIPEALYVDKKTVFVTNREPTIEEQLKGEEPMTQFGRACNKLGIRIICANSPQAKGRVERNHAVYQDRLVKEFRLKDISAIDKANELLRNGFIDKLNSKFTVSPADPLDRHRPTDKGVDLRKVFCLEYERYIENDFTLRFKARRFQITKQTLLPPTKSKITVQQHLDGSIHLIYQDRELEFTEISPQIQTKEVIKEIKPKKIAVNVPSPEHPWRRHVRRPERLVGATP